MIHKPIQCYSSVNTFIWSFSLKSKICNADRQQAFARVH